ncbi:MAG: J domain-containing protein [Ilumatobacteraceae bacterium]
MTAGDHYDTLGVPREATQFEIREAYRQLAREQHPDRLEAGSVHLDSMAGINEAYRVLSDAGRRAVYDATLRGTGSAVPRSERTSSSSAGVDGEWTGSEGFAAAAAARHPNHLGPARVPWRMLLFCGTLAVIGVVVLAQFNKPGEPAAPDGILRIGDCVAYEANGDAREVRCIGNSEEPSSEDLVVVAFVPFDSTCPGLTEPHRDRQGMGVACIPIDD